MVGFIYTWLETITTGRRVFLSEAAEVAERICSRFTVAPESEPLLCRAGIVQKKNNKDQTPK